VAQGIKALKQHGATRIGVVNTSDPHAAAEASTLALFDHSYSKSFSDKTKDESNVLTIPVQSDSRDIQRLEDDRAWARGVVYGTAQNLARRWMDTPSNLMTPRLFAQEVHQHLGSLPGVEIHERDTAWAEEQGMGCFLGVTKGSAEPARFLEIRYRGRLNTEEWSLGLVGKGVTFDTGGIDLKPWQGMEDMKGDMGGAACVAATLYGIAQLGLPLNVVCAIPLCENMPDGQAIKPGDVLRAMNGKTVEVLNTDAEGRLILADALYYVSSTYKPPVLLDVATLTGAMMVALGSTYTGVFTNSDRLWSDLQIAGNSTYELLWRMPMHPEYRKAVHSSRVADLANISEGRGGGACTAAMFLREFVGQPAAPDSELGDHPNQQERLEWQVESAGEPCHYAHVDMAGTMDCKSSEDYHHKGMTGRPTRALLEYAYRLAQQ
ncbi:hypothetical protein IWQ61_002435, partial [Dispira simplex]